MERGLSEGQQLEIKQASGQAVDTLKRALLVVEGANLAQAKLLSWEAFQSQRDSGKLPPNTWVFDSRSKSWQGFNLADAPEAISSVEEVDSVSMVDPTPPTETKEAPVAKVEAKQPAAAQPATDTQKFSKDTVKSTDPMLPEINIFKDNKQHLFYSLKHLQARIDTGFFSLADWGWDDDVNDWVPLSQLLPKIEPLFADESVASADPDSSALKAKVSELEEENRVLKATVERLKQTSEDTSRTTLEKDELRTEVESLQRQLDDSQRRQSQARQDFEEELERQKSAHQIEVDELNQQLSSLRKSFENLEQTAQENERQLEEKSDSLKSSQMTRRQQETTISELEGELEDSRKHGRSLETELEDERKNVADKEERISGQDLRIEELQEELRLARVRVEELESTVSDRTLDAEVTVAKLREHRERLSHLDEQIEAVISRIDKEPKTDG